MKIAAAHIVILLLALSSPASALIIGDSVVYEQESAVQLEDWMFEELIPNVEVERSLQDWMFEPLTENIEESLTFENWMFEPLNNHEESEFGLEDWMFN